MSSDYKPVNDQSLSDLNRANRDMWDAGPMVHGDAVAEDRVITSPTKAAETFGSSAAEMAKKGNPKAGIVAQKAAHLGRAGLAEQRGHTSAKTLSGRDNVVDLAEDVRHNPKGQQQIVHGEQVVVQHDDWPESASRAAEKGAPFKQIQGPLTKVQSEYGEKRKKDLKSIGIVPTEGEHMNRRAIIARHPENDETMEGRSVAGDAVHLPRTGKKTWRKTNWS